MMRLYKCDRRCFTTSGAGIIQVKPSPLYPLRGFLSLPQCILRARPSAAAVTLRLALESTKSAPRQCSITIAGLIVGLSSRQHSQQRVQHRKRKRWGKGVDQSDRWVACLHIHAAGNNSRQETASNTVGAVTLTEAPYLLVQVFCGNFEYDAPERAILDLFEKYGEVHRIDMKTGEPWPLVARRQGMGSQPRLTSLLRSVKGTGLTPVQAVHHQQQPHDRPV